LSPSLPLSPVSPPSEGDRARLSFRIAGGRFPLLRLLVVARPAAGWMILGSLLGLLTVLSGVGLLAASAYVLSAAALQPSIADLQPAIVAIRFFGLSRAVLRYLERLVSHQATFKLLAHLRLWFFDAVEPLAPARLQETRAGDLLARALADIETLQEFYLRGISPPLVAVATALLVSAVLAGTSPPLAVANLALALGGGLGLAWVMQRRSRRLAQRIIAPRAWVSHVTLQALQGLTDWKIYGGTERWIADLSQASLSWGRAQEDRARGTSLLAAFSTAWGFLAAASAIAVLTPRALEGAFPAVLLASYTLGLLASYEPVASLPAAAEQASTSSLAATRLMEVLDSEPAVNERVGQSIAPQFSSLELEQLAFNYPGSARPILEDVNLSLVAGERLAILGRSGSGKSTLVRLLLRFWAPSRGRLLLNGEDMQSLLPESVRKFYAPLTQPMDLMSATLGENIALGHPTASSETLLSVLSQAGLDPLLERLPDGLDTYVGEMGFALSAGERQRVGLARALIRPAPVLLLDEPTHGLDAATASEVLDRLLAGLQGRSLILLTHDVSRLERLDRIIVLEQGRIQACGPHDELQRSNRLYQWMLAQRKEEGLLQRLQRVQSSAAGVSAAPA
jgi:ATP-binding cassette subfamily C protein CydC